MTDETIKHPDLPTMGPTIGSVPKPKEGAAPFFVIGADDRPLDTRIIAIAIGANVEIKVGDREFSCSIGLHEIVCLRHYYDARAGSGSIRLVAKWPPGLSRERPMTHSDLALEAKRMAQTYVVPKQNQQLVRSFDAFFGAEPTEQLKRLHAVMREQYEAWRVLVGVAMKRLPPDTGDLVPEMRLSMAFDLITEREIEQIALIADPSRRGLDVIQLEEITPEALETTPAAPSEPITLETIREQANALADKDIEPPTVGELAVEALKKRGFDDDRAVNIGALVDQYGADIRDDDLLRAAGSKPKAAEARLALTQILKMAPR